MTAHKHAEAMVTPMPHICKTPAVYCITFKGSSRVYIGSAVWPSRRRRQHLHLLRKNSHHCMVLQSSFNKYKEDNILIGIVKWCGEDDLVEAEQSAIDSIKRSELMNSTADASNPMRDKKVVEKWISNLSQEERNRRSKTINEVRSREGFALRMEQGRAKYLESGGREALAESCRNNRRRREAVSKEMKRRWETPEYREKMKKATIASIAKQVMAVDKVNGKTYRFESLASACRGLSIEGSKRRNVQACLNGKQKTAYGYKWSFL